MIGKSTIKVEAIRPKEFDIRALRGPLYFECQAIAKDIRKEYEKTTKGWHRRPEFRSTVDTSSGAEVISIRVWTDVPVYNYLDHGVKEHWIYPRKKRKSGTAATYIPFSKPNSLSVNANGGRKVIPGAGYLVLNQSFLWPGIEPRNFTLLIQEKLSDSGSLQASKRFQAVIDKHAHKVWR